MDWSWFIIGVFIALVGWLGYEAYQADGGGWQQKRNHNLERKQRHAACLARITEIEADALMPLDEWLEREMARREAKALPKPHRYEIAARGHREHLEDAIQKHDANTRSLEELKQRLAAIRGNYPAITRGTVPAKRDPYDMSDYYRNTRYIIPGVSLLNPGSILSPACQDKAHEHCHAMQQVRMPCRCDCHVPLGNLASAEYDIHTQEARYTSMACGIKNHQECYPHGYGDNASDRQCACPCHEQS